MKPHSKVRALLWLILLFSSGAVLGNALGPEQSIRPGWWKRPAVDAPLESFWIQRRIDNLSERFNLTPEQMKSLRPAFDTAESRLRSIHERAADATRRVMLDNNRAVLEVMTPEQQAKFDAWRQEYRARLQSQ